ncbi:MAG: MarR family transcriptional regulator [Acidimicrobiales bacterium]|jgi:DNA-binding MarR family transcriptional regulator
MDDSLDVYEIAGNVQMAVSLLRRRMRQSPVDGELTLPEHSALLWLDREGPTTSAALARLEQISAQSMGATLSALESRGLLQRRADSVDGRKTILSLTAEGTEKLRNRRNARAEQLARALTTGFTHSELRQLKAAVPLLERLAQRI